MLAAGRAYEERAASIYRGFAERMRAEPEAHALWSALARDEEEHAGTLARASQAIAPTEGWRVQLDGWREALAEIDARMAAAESPEVGSDLDRQLAVALALERSELDPLYHQLTEAAGMRAGGNGHVARLLAVAETRADPAVRMQAALLRARRRLCE